MRKIAFISIFLLLLSAGVSAQGNKDEDKQISDSINLQEVVVSEKMITRKAGQYIVDAVQLRKGKTDLFDLLGNIPGIITSDDDIKIQGRSGVRVMFNGRMKNLPTGEIVNMLKAQRASNVVKVEVITSPGAKYDAGGDYGILNIITERGNDYIGGEVGDDVTYADKWKNNSRLNLNYQQGRVTASLNAGWTYGDDAFTERNTSYFTDMTRVSRSSLRWRNNNYNVTGAIDFMLDSLSTVGVEAYYFDNHRRYPSLGHEETYSPAGDMTLRSISPAFDLRDGSNADISFYIDRNWSADNKIAFMFDLFKFKNDKDYDFNSYYYKGDTPIDSTDYVSNAAGAHLKGLSFTLDYSAALPWAVKLEAGVKTSLTETQNMSHYDLSSLPVQDDDFTYTENIYAGYLVLNKTLGSFDFVLGGRYELTHTKSQSKGGTATTDNYGRFFPNVHVMYRTKNGSSFDLGVNSGIKRPGIQVVNPFRAYVSANSIAQGNPTIRPDHWFNVRLTSNIVLCSGLDLGSEITFTREFDNITQITEMDGTNGISTTQWQNAYDLTWFGFDVSLYYYGLSWLRAYVDGCFSYQETTSDSRYSLPREYHASSFAMADLRFFFDRRRTFTGYLTAMYTGRDKTVTGTLEDRFFMNCGVACSLLKNKLNLKLGVSNILASDVRGTSRSNDGMYMRFSNSYSPLSVTLGLSYSFGKDIRVKQKKHSNSDIERRF